jgi:hypothetical protein
MAAESFDDPSQLGLNIVSGAESMTNCGAGEMPAIVRELIDAPKQLLERCGQIGASQDPKGTKDAATDGEVLAYADPGSGVGELQDNAWYLSVVVVAEHGLGLVGVNDLSLPIYEPERGGIELLGIGFGETAGHGRSLRRQVASTCPVRTVRHPQLARPNARASGTPSFGTAPSLLAS